MNTSQWGMVQSIYTVGGLVGALLGGPFATHVGPLFAIKCACPFLFFGSAAEAFAQDLSILALGRFLSGTGAGSCTVVCPIYVAQVSPVSKRGVFGSFTQVMINAGILVAQLLGFFLSHGKQWRLIFLVGSAISLAQYCGCVLSSESPRWLAENHRPLEAQRVLQIIRGAEFDFEPEIQEWTVQCDGMGEQEPLLGPSTGRGKLPSPKISVITVLRERRHRRALVAVTIPMLAQQLCGINSVVMYSISILGAVLPSAAAGLVTVLVSGINVLVTVVCSPLVDRWGRKTCLLLSIGGMGTGAALLALGLAADVPAVSVVATLSFVCSFGLGLGPVPFILAPELVVGGPQALGPTSSLALAANWLSTFTVAQFFPMLNHALPRGAAFSLFTALAAVFAVLVWRFVPESAGATTAEEVWRSFDGEREREAAD